MCQNASSRSTVRENSLLTISWVCMIGHEQAQNQTRKRMCAVNNSLRDPSLSIKGETHAHPSPNNSSWIHRRKYWDTAGVLSPSSECPLPLQVSPPHLCFASEYHPPPTSLLYHCVGFFNTLNKTSRAEKLGPGSDHHQHGCQGQKC